MPIPASREVWDDGGLDGAVMAPRPTGSERVASDVDAFYWAASAPVASVLLVPGWGGHPAYYGTLVRALLGARIAVISSVPAGQMDVTSTAHYDALPVVAAWSRQRVAGVPQILVADSLGCPHSLARLTASEFALVVLIAPGLIPHRAQVWSRNALRDLGRFLVTGRVPITGWRLDLVSDNEEFRRAVRLSALTPPFSDLRFMVRSAGAAVVVLWRSYDPPLLVVYGSSDRVVSRLGTALIVRRFRSARSVVRCEGVQHGVLWDRAEGASIAQSIVAEILRVVNP